MNYYYFNLATNNVSILRPRKGYKVIATRKDFGTFMADFKKHKDKPLMERIELARK